MIECQPGIYEVLLETDRGVTNKINIFYNSGKQGREKFDDRYRLPG